MLIRCKHCKELTAREEKFCSHCGKDHSAPVDETDFAGKTREEVLEIIAERERTTEILALGRKLEMPEEKVSELVNSGVSLDDARFQMLKQAQEAMPPAIIPKADAADKFRAIASASLLVSAGLEHDEKTIREVRSAGHEVAPISLQALIRSCLGREGRVHPTNIMQFTSHDLASHAFRMASQGSSDLPAILADTANKSLARGFNEAPVTFKLWCGEDDTTVRDFKETSLVKMSNFSDIDDIPEGMAFKDGRFSDKKETVSVDTKGKKFSLTRQAIINDDLNSFTKIPFAMMSSVARRINKDVYDKLTSNSLTGPQMTEDSYYMFDASNHGNLVQTSGVPSVNTIGAAEAKLMMMKLPKPDLTSVQQYTNLTGKYLITGVNNRLTVQQVLSTGFDPAQSMAGVFNPYTGLIPVTDAYLQSLLTAADKANAWYLAADRNQIESVVVYYLAGSRTPTLRNQPSGIGEALGISWDIFMDWGIGVPDYRGIVYNDGVSA